jgi:Dolichyl-phosphate-mannose-protein mannosyltransferase
MAEARVTPLRTASAAPADVLRRAGHRLRFDELTPAEGLARAPAVLYLAPVLVLAAVLRVWQVNEVGFNSDEAVYAGQAASIADDPELSEFFPIFRAHPLLFQTILSLGFQLHLGEGFARLVVAAIGVATVLLVYELGRLLYGRPAGLIAALLMALMPYHVVVTRQVLLDGPMTFFATLTLVLLVRFVLTGRTAWLYSTGAAMGLTFLAKETSIVLLGAIYAFLALTPEIAVRLRDLAISAGVMALVIAPFPLSLMLAGRAATGESYLTWQLFRRPNHDWLFSPTTVPEVLGPFVLIAALIGLWLLRSEASWRETLLLSWVAVPVVFFQLWPVKGFQYLLPVAPAVAVLAGRALSRLPAPGRRGWQALAVALVAISLLVPAWDRVDGAPRDTLLAGSGGLPGGRETGEWIREHVPARAAFLTIGPSMANLVQYYGRRRAYGLSVSPNPLNRNPSYEPVVNPDRAIRDSQLQYLVWDSFSAGRSARFSDKLLAYADRYNGRVVHTEVLPARTPLGESADRPSIVVFEVRP